MRRQLAVINKSSYTIDFTQLAAATKSLQTQIDRDLFPVWGSQAQISPMHPQDPINTNIWTINILDKSEFGLGVHLHPNGIPFAEVQYDPQSWDNTTVTLSHEMMEMLVDPFGNRFLKALDIDPASDGHLVSYLVEVGDPCETSQYYIDGVAVSDFITPEYYNNRAPPFTQLDYLRKLEKPFDVPEGCYISYEDPVDHNWHQKNVNGEFVSLGSIDNNKNPREDRDDKIGGDDDQDARHNLSPILSRYAKRFNSKSK